MAGPLLMHQWLLRLQQQPTQVLQIPTLGRQQLRQRLQEMALLSEVVAIWDQEIWAAPPMVPAVGITAT
jgi:hypothetical protein